MASLRIASSKDGKQRCLTFDEHAVALRFREQVGADRAQDIANIETGPARR